MGETRAKRRTKSATPDRPRSPRSPDAAPRVFIVGTGRLGGALALALRKAGWSVATQQRSPAARLDAARLGIPGDDFPLRHAKIVLLCARDTQIGPLAESLAERIGPAQVVAHCAGSLDLAPLAPLRKRGAHVGSLHPLCSIPTPRSPLAGAAAVQGDRLAARSLEAVARAAGLEPFRLPPCDRGLYHAAAVLAANGTVSLAEEARRIFAQCGVPPEKALGAAVGLIRSAADALEREGLPGALTGPIARGDILTVQRHLDALFTLDDDPGHAMYRSNSFNLLLLAQRLGQAGPERILAIFALLLEEQRRGYEKYKVLSAR